MRHFLAAIIIATLGSASYAEQGDSAPAASPAADAASPAAADADVEAENDAVMARYKALNSSETPEANLAAFLEAARAFLFDHPDHERAEAIFDMYFSSLRRSGVDSEEIDARMRELRDPSRRTRVQTLLDVHEIYSRHLTEYGIDAGGSYPELEEMEARLPGDPIVISALGMMVLHASMSDETRVAEVDELLASPHLPGVTRERLERWRAFQSKTGAPASFKFTDLNGVEIDTADWKGKVILVDFWATWCGPCVAELPRIKAFYDKHHAEGLEVLGVSFDQDMEVLSKFVAKRELPWPQYPARSEANAARREGERWGIDAIPHVLLIDRKGNLRSLDARSDMDVLIPLLLAEEK